MLIFHACPLVIVHFMKKETLLALFTTASPFARLNAWHIVGFHDTIVEWMKNGSEFWSNLLKA